MKYNSTKRNEMQADYEAPENPLQGARESRQPPRRRAWPDGERAHTRCPWAQRKEPGAIKLTGELARW